MVILGMPNFLEHPVFFVWRVCQVWTAICALSPRARDPIFAQSEGGRRGLFKAWNSISSGIFFSLSWGQKCCCVDGSERGEKLAPAKAKLPPPASSFPHINSWRVNRWDGRMRVGGALGILVYPGTKSGTLAQAADKKKLCVCVSISFLDLGPEKEGRPEKKREIFSRLPLLRVSRFYS